MKWEWKKMLKKKRNITEEKKEGESRKRIRIRVMKVSIRIRESHLVMKMSITREVRKMTEVRNKLIMISRMSRRQSSRRSVHCS